MEHFTRGHQNRQHRRPVGGSRAPVRAALRRARQDLDEPTKTAHAALEPEPGSAAHSGRAPSWGPAPASPGQNRLAVICLDRGVALVTGEPVARAGWISPRSIAGAPRRAGRLPSREGRGRSLRADVPHHTRKPSDRNNARQRVVDPVAEEADTLALERTGRPLPEGLTAHRFRHTFASLLLAHDPDPANAMVQLGHTDPAFTIRVYTHLMRRSAREREAARALIEGTWEPEKAPTGTRDARRAAAPTSPGRAGSAENRMAKR